MGQLIGGSSKMKISKKRLLFIVCVMVVWNIMWLLFPHNVGSRRCIEGVSWECKQILQQMTEKEIGGCIVEIKEMKGWRK